MRSVSFFIKSIFAGFLGKSQIMIVDEEFIAILAFPFIDADWPSDADRVRERRSGKNGQAG